MTAQQISKTVGKWVKNKVYQNRTLVVRYRTVNVKIDL